jgi:hypothetical protein
MSKLQETIQIIVKPDGSAVIKAKGFVGDACRRATQNLERALGEATAEQLTPEFYLAQETRQENKTQN